MIAGMFCLENVWFFTLLKCFLQFYFQYILNLSFMMHFYLEVSQETLCRILSLFLVYRYTILVLFLFDQKNSVSPTITFIKL